MPYRKLYLFVPSQISYYVMAKSDTNEFGRLIASSIGIAVPKNRNNRGYISEVYGFGMNGHEVADIAADLAADMLGKILGFKIDPNQTWSGKEQVYKTSGLIIRTSNITQTTKGQENLWTTTVAIAMFSLDWKIYGE